MRLRAGKFADPWHGNGVFVALLFRHGWAGVSLRWRWRLASVRWPEMPEKRRWYIGPIEVDYVHLGSHVMERM